MGSRDYIRGGAAHPEPPVLFLIVYLKQLSIWARFELKKLSVWAGFRHFSATCRDCWLHKGFEVMAGEGRGEVY